MSISGGSIGELTISGNPTTGPVVTPPTNPLYDNVVALGGVPVAAINLSITAGNVPATTNYYIAKVTLGNYGVTVGSVPVSAYALGTGTGGIAATRDAAVSYTTTEANIHESFVELVGYNANSYAQIGSQFVELVAVSATPTLQIVQFYTEVVAIMQNTHGAILTSVST